MFELMTKMYADMQEMKGGMQAIHGDMRVMQSDMQEVKERLLNVEKTVLNIEQDHGKKLQALFDGYKQHSDQLDRIEKEVAKHEEVILRRIK